MFRGLYLPIVPLSSSGFLVHCIENILICIILFCCCCYYVLKIAHQENLTHCKEAYCRFKFKQESSELHQDLNNNNCGSFSPTLIRVLEECLRLVFNVLCLFFVGCIDLVTPIDVNYKAL